MKRKPKFRVGQVVRVRASGVLIQIDHRDEQGGVWYYWFDSNSVGFDERDLRPLTKREKGDARS